MQPPATTTSRFVILRHEPGPRSERLLHWDFMLEAGAALRTWALANEPDAAESVSALALADHRLAYLEFEGPVTGERGHVTRWDEGTYRIIRDDACRLTVELNGARLCGRVELESEPGHEDHWTFRFSSGRAATSALGSGGS